MSTRPESRATAAPATLATADNFDDDAGADAAGDDSDGRAAVDAFAAGRFDLLLMDVQMPGMDGLEATAAIRTIERGSGARVPIVALTAHALAEDRERCLAAGMDAFLTKPLRAPQLNVLLDRYLSTSDRAA